VTPASRTRGTSAELEELVLEDFAGALRAIEAGFAITAAVSAGDELLLEQPVEHRAAAATGHLAPGRASLERVDRPDMVTTSLRDRHAPPER
jgi:hypothetical protein